MPFQDFAKKIKGGLEIFTNPKARKEAIEGLNIITPGEVGFIDFAREVKETITERKLLPKPAQKLSKFLFPTFQERTKRFTDKGLSSEEAKTQALVEQQFEMLPIGGAGRVVKKVPSITKEVSKELEPLFREAKGLGIDIDIPIKVKKFIDNNIPFRFRGKVFGLLPENLQKDVHQWFVKNSPESLSKGGKIDKTVILHEVTDEIEDVIKKRGLRTFPDITKKGELLPIELKFAEQIIRKGKSIQSKEAQGFFNQAVRGIKKVSSGLIETKTPKVLFKQLDNISEQIKRKDITNQQFSELQTRLRSMEEIVFSDPARQLAKYVSRTTGELPEVLGKGKTIFGKRGDDIVTELGFQNTDEAINAVNNYLRAREQLRQLKIKISPLREKISSIRKGERLIQLTKGDRRMTFRAVRNAFGLTDRELSKIKGGKDILAMETSEFREFINRVESLAERISKTRTARINLEFTIQNKELNKVENLQKALKFPSIDKMTAEQLDEFDLILQQFKHGDEFLGVRQLETVKNTDLKGIKTIREAKERLAKQIGVSVKELEEVQVRELDRFLYDVALAERNPFYRMMVNENTKAMLNANARFFSLKRELNTLINSARKSRPRGVLARLIPTDKKIFQWLEADDAGKLTVKLTLEELKAAQRIRDLYIKARDYLIQFEVLKRYKSDYITHIRRGFLEAWKEDGLMTAFKEVFEQYKLDEAMFNILDQKTGEILPLEKFFRFSMRRTGKLKPTQNVASAVLAYFRAFEKKKALDSIVPKIDIYAHSLTPKNLTPRGLEYDDSLKRFVKQWLNTKKGRPAEALLVKPGGRIDWAMRMGVALTRTLDLGFGIPIGVAASVGEQVMTFIAVGSQKYSLGLIRWATKRGREITNKYPEFVGESLSEKFSDAARSIDDKVLETAFSLFAEGSRKANQIFLLGSMTKDEFAKGALSLERLTNLRLGIGRYRVVEGFSSIFGATAPGNVMKQYKTWAVPIFLTVSRDSKILLKQLRGGQLKWTPENQALLRSVVLTSAVGFGLYGYYKRLKNKKNRTFSEDLIFKAIRDSLTAIQALQPGFWFGVPRLIDFLADVGKAADQIIKVERNSSGELKGVKSLKQTFLPSPLRMFLRKEKKVKSSKNLDLGLENLEVEDIFKDLKEQLKALK